MRTTFCAVAMLLAIGATTRAQDRTDDSSAAPAAPKGSIASQLDLRYKLKAASQGLELATALNHSREDWERLLPDERQRIRRVALAILKESDEKQQVIIERWKKLQDMTPERLAAYRRRARVYKAVMESLTEQERKDLMNMSLKDRARKVLAIRDELIAEGTLTLEEPTTQPVEPTHSENGDPNTPK